MSIKKYTNFEGINLKTENEGKFIGKEDFVIISKNETEETDFGDCHYDVMEVSVYDINNNLLPQESGNTVAFIRSGDIKNYLYNITKGNVALGDGRGQRELAIDVEKLLTDLGFTNGILRVNINFVRSRVGTENSMRRAWIQEISPSRTEIRIVPLKTSNQYFTDINYEELDKLKNLNKDFKYYRRSILDSLNSFDNIFTKSIDTYLQTKYGDDFFNILRKDFGLRQFDDFTKKIYEDFKTSVTYYLTNRYYDIEQSNYGKTSEMRFDDCEQYDFNTLTAEIQVILFKCIHINSTFLKRRDITITELPKEFKEVDLTPHLSQTIIPQPQIVQVANDVEPPKVVAVPPQEVSVPQAKNTYYYSIKNASSLRSMVFKFVDAGGTAVQKTLAAGQVLEICAQENTVSTSEVTGPTVLGTEASPVKPKTKSETQIDNARYGSDDDNDYTISKGQPCDKVQIGVDAPVYQPPKQETTYTPEIPIRETIPPKSTTTSTIPPKSGTVTGNTKDTSSTMSARSGETNPITSETLSGTYGGRALVN